MVQVQSTWFPVIDRNPQKFVTNIFEAEDSGLSEGRAEGLSHPLYPAYISLPGPAKQ